MGRKRRARGKAVNGWLVVDKPAGVTSTDVVNTVRKVTEAAKAGHAGTLDPIATGILPVALGEATKTVGYVMEGRKRYRFTLRWGQATATDDSEGEVTATSPERPSADAIAAALPGFTGTLAQLPPQYSAVKVDGQRAYDLAREGESVELPTREVAIDRFELVDSPDSDHSVFEVTAGKGAYIRALARDLGEALGTYGHVAALRRLAVGPFDESQAIPLDQLAELGHSPRALEPLLAVEAALADIPALALSEGEAQQLRQGQAVPLLAKADRARLSGIPKGATILARWAGSPVGLARVKAGQLQPVRMLNL